MTIDAHHVLEQFHCTLNDVSYMCFCLLICQLLITLLSTTLGTL